MARAKDTRTPLERLSQYAHTADLEPRTPETGHTELLPDEEHLLEFAFGDGWVKGLEVARIDGDRNVIVDIDPQYDPVLLWCGRQSRRTVPVLPLQRNEIIPESRIVQIVAKAMQVSASAEEDVEEQGQLTFAEVEKAFREKDRENRIQFYSHEEEWKNKLICGDSLLVMESLLRYEGLRGQIQMVYVDPPYGVDYDSNFQQRIDSTKNDDSDRADDVLTIRAYNDTWLLGVHSYLSHLHERFYVARELLAESGSIFVQMGEDNVHLVRALLDEVFGKTNFVSEIVFLKTSGKGGGGLDAVYDTLLWYAKDKGSLKYRQLYRARPAHTLAKQYRLIEEADGTVRPITAKERDGVEPLPQGARRFMPDQLSSQGESSGEGSEPFEFGGIPYELPPNTHWKTSHKGLTRLAELGRIHPIGKRLRYKRYTDDFPLAPYTNVWDDTVISGYAAPKLYAVQTSPKVVERCIQMTTEPGDIIFDPTGGSGTTAWAAEKLGRRWITCDTSRVATNVTRQRLLSAVFPHYALRGATPSADFVYDEVDHITLESLAKDLEPEQEELFDQAKVERGVVRVTGPFEVMTIGRYALEDWHGVLASGDGRDGDLENYVEVICRLYRKDASVQGASGLIHATAETEDERLALSVGPIAGRVSARQLSDAAHDAAAAGLHELHVLGWAFEANVGELKGRLEEQHGIGIRLVMIRPDTLATGLKTSTTGALFAPLALPDIEVEQVETSKMTVRLNGVSVFDRKSGAVDFKGADSGYVAAWYLDEDYDDDCFVDCQLFFDFKKKPAIERTLKVEIDPDEWKLRTVSDPFELGAHRKISVRVVDIYGNESTVVVPAKAG